MHAKWNRGNSEDTLKNINLSMNSGELLAVIGPVGAGKVRTSRDERAWGEGGGRSGILLFGYDAGTRRGRYSSLRRLVQLRQLLFFSLPQSSLLQAVLGELATTDGQLRVGGKVSYACQEPWLFAASIRQNITFGSEFDRKRYDRVVRACALLPDLAQLPFGDLTLVGERGSSLSGGQRARVNLAR